MADKIIVSISYIRTVSKKKATIEKMLAHLPKSKICDKTWSTESLKVLLSDMTAKNQIELVDSGYKINQNEGQDDNDNEAQDDNDDNCNFVENTQIDCTSSVSDNLEANLGVRYTYSFTPGWISPLGCVRPCLWSNLSFCIHVQPR